MSSGSYFPPPVRAVSIPKKTGGQRILGVPTVADRVAQMVVKQLIEPDLEPNQMLLAWVMRKFKRFKAHKIRTSRFLQKLAQEKAGLFAHWRLGMTGTFA